MAVENVNQAKHELFGGDSVSGNWGAILRATGIDIRELPQVMDGTAAASVLRGGHWWTVEPWEGGGGFAVATRPQTAAECESEKQRLMRSTFSSYFSQDRLVLCTVIAERVAKLSARLRPDCPPSRAKRRTIRRQLDRLSSIQIELLTNKYANVAQLERELKESGTW